MPGSDGGFRRELACAFLVAALAAYSQTEPAALPKFEVASVKSSSSENDRGVTGGPGSSDPGRYSFHSATLLDLIATSYHVDYFQILSKISLDRQRFDLDAKLPPGTTRDDFRLMLRDLLIERFRMKARTEVKEFPSYALVVAKSGAKLKRIEHCSAWRGHPFGRRLPGFITGTSWVLLYANP